MGSSVRGGYKLSNESLLERLSCDIFITNFPVHLSAKELRNTCAQYGTVQDVYISRKLSKQCKPFAFARFNKVNDVATLIKILRSIWLRNFRIYANVARFMRESKPKSFSQNSAPKEHVHVSSKPRKHVHEWGSLNYGVDHVLVVCVKDFKTLPNIHKVCLSEGFSGVKISYLGGYWVLLEFESLKSCEKFQTHNGINSWFSSVKQWNAQFEIPDIVVWIDVEGTTLQAWSHATFNRIASKWGELVYMDEPNASNKYSMCLCVKTRVHHLIVESFKVILEGKVSVVRAKEVTGWVPDFEEGDIAQSEEGSDNNSNSPDDVENSSGQMKNSLDHVENYDVHMENSPEISYKQLDNSLVHVKNSLEQMENFHDHVENSSVHVDNSHVNVENSPDLYGDPFGISSLGTIKSVPKKMSPRGSRHDHVDSLAPSPKPINGFSILERFQEFISIGQAMGFDMKGCEEDYRRIIISMGDHNNFK
ncbi:RNA-directed DNA polymerase, eukaryota, reverse transcriptase zinc-binding domain protein [Tanacetum coccineum]